MKTWFYQLLVGFNQPNKRVRERAIRKRFNNIKAIWKNTNHNDLGIERLLRLVLAVSPFLFPGTYLKDAAGRYGSLKEDLIIDAYVLFKLILPLLILYFDLADVHIYGISPFVVLTVWMLLETQLYIPTLIFAGDLYSKPRSYRRSVILVMINYFEIVLDFAVLYYALVTFNTPLKSKLDAIYFSFVSSSTIGYGDFYPVDNLGKILVIFQSVIFIMLIILFINFFTNKVEQKGYFGPGQTPDD